MWPSRAQRQGWEHGQHQDFDMVVSHSGANNQNNQTWVSENKAREGQPTVAAQHMAARDKDSGSYL
jgi:hypothetical protein